MTPEEKLLSVKTFLEIPAEDTSLDSELNTYLSFAKMEILNWRYINKGGIPEGVTDIPQKYEGVQIMAVVAGYNLKGAENETVHSENGISRTFAYSDMVQYIRTHVFQLI